ncbi:hypothetical protein I4U23_027402 [Adineta vaga]|nr:hypothetical protein I4U23_027402 [Adineta vaga]
MSSTIWIVTMALLIENSSGISFNQPKFSSCTVWNTNATKLANKSLIGHQPTGIFVNTQNNIYVSVLLNNHITLNRTNGTSVMHINSSCTGLFIDIINDLYCSSANEYKIFKLKHNSNTSISMVVAGTGCPGPVPNMLDHPHGIFVDENFNLFVADSHNNRIQLFQPGQLNAMTIVGFGAPVAIPLNRPTISKTTKQTIVSPTSACINSETSPAGRAPTIACQNNPPYEVGRNGCGKCLNLTKSLQQSVLVNVTPYIDLRSISFSVESWIKPTILVTDGFEHVIFGQCAKLRNRNCMRTSIGKRGAVSFLFRGDTLTDSRLIPIDVWSHVAYVYNLTGLTMSLYINGTLQVSNGNHGPYQGVANPLEIGNSAQYGSLYFSGCIDEISFYPFARTNFEIASTFARG